MQRLDLIKILVVDDNLDNLSLFALMLRSLGAEVEAANSVKEAQQKFSIFKPEIVLTDISMPEEDGYALIRKIRSLTADQERGVPVIALTAYVSDDEVERIYNAGFTDRIFKPVSRPSLSDKIWDVLRSENRKSIDGPS